VRAFVACAHTYVIRARIDSFRARILKTSMKVPVFSHVFHFRRRKIQNKKEIKKLLQMLYIRGNINYRKKWMQ